MGWSYALHSVHVMRRKLQFYWWVWILVGMALLLGSAVTVGVLVLEVRVFILPADLSPRWITVERGNRACPAAERRWYGERLEISASGYLCVSDSLSERWMYEFFFASDESGRWRRLGYQEEIHVRQTVTQEEGTCRITADSFWYGPRYLITNEATVFIDKYHPECQHSPAG
jgi:hypothetical protein